MGRSRKEIIDIRKERREKREEIIEKKLLDIFNCLSVRVFFATQFSCVAKNVSRTKFGF
ncbi:hypothetical protein MWU76_10900 [Gelidibacter sp. F2691]|nr:hypothetical protein [Gelidibacter sp. F2691]